MRIDLEWTSWLTGCLGIAFLALGILVVPESRVFAYLPSCATPGECGTINCLNPPCSEKHAGCKNTTDCLGCNCMPNGNDCECKD